MQASFSTRAASRVGAARIDWDQWGVPHVFSSTQEGLFFGLGWAQMRNHRSELLRLYGKARGRAAEYWGEQYLPSDEWVHTMGVPRRARLLRRRQSPRFGRRLDAFAAGINAYAEQHRSAIPGDLAQVLPVDATDVLAHVHSLVHFYFLVSRNVLKNADRHVNRGGSNAWAAIPPFATGGAMLLANPHLNWIGSETFFEVHLSSGKLDFYGATLLGFPVPIMGFNSDMAWTHTVNRSQAFTLYDLSLSGTQYCYDGGWQSLTAMDVPMAVRDGKGAIKRHHLTVRRSVHGPVIASQGNQGVALRVAGLGCSGMCHQWWNMAQARNLREFEAALQPLQLPMFNVLYAGRDRHILYLFGGRIPVRPPGAWNWSGAVPGDTSRTLWTRTHAYADLPRVVDPPSGWLQNANDSPQTCTVPQVIRKEDYPPYFQNGAPTSRAQRAIRMISGRSQVTFDDLLEIKLSTRSELADRVVPDLVRLAREDGRPDLRQAADVLDSWDRHANPHSRGAVLFLAFANRMLRESREFIPFTTPWNVSAPLSTPSGIRDSGIVISALANATREMLERFGSLDPPWGDVYRIRRNGLDLPAIGGPDLLGVVRVLEFEPDGDRRYRASGGDSFMFAVEFIEGRCRARTLLPYGNATESEPKQYADQFGLYAEGRWREPLLSFPEIQRHLENSESLPY